MRFEALSQCSRSPTPSGRKTIRKRRKIEQVRDGKGKCEKKKRRVRKRKIEGTEGVKG